MGLDDRIPARDILEKLKKMPRRIRNGKIDSMLFFA
jgi:hypothetical protein